MYRFHDILAKSTPPRVTVATKPSHAQNPAAMPAPSVFAPIQPTSMLSTAAVTSEPIKVKVMVFPMPSRLMLCWLMPIIDIHVLPKSGPYQTQPMINCAIAAITMATQFTGCHPLWFLLQLETWSVGKLDGPNSSTLQLFNSPTRLLAFFRECAGHLHVHLRQRLQLLSNLARRRLVGHQPEDRRTGSAEGRAVSFPSEDPLLYVTDKGMGGRDQVLEDVPQQPSDITHILALHGVCHRGRIRPRRDGRRIQLPVGPLRRHCHLRPSQDDPGGRQRGQECQAFAPPARYCRSTFKEEGHVRPQFHRQRHQLAAIEPEFPQLRQSQQRHRRVRAAAAQTRGRRNAFHELNLHIALHG